MPIRSLLGALRSATDIDEDPARLPVVMVRTLTIGSTFLALLGVFAFIALGPDPSLLALPVGGGALAIWGYHSLRIGRPRPIPMLAAAALAGTAYLMSAMLADDVGRASDATPIVLVTSTGVIAFLVGGERTRRAIWAMLPLVALGILASQTVLDGDPVAIAVDVAAASLVVAITYRLAGQLSSTAHVSTNRLTNVFDTAPVGIVEADLSKLRRSGATVVGQPSYVGFNRVAIDMLGPGVLDGARRPQDRALLESMRTLGAQLLSTDESEGSGRLSTDNGTELLVTWRKVDRLHRVLLCLVDHTPQRQASEALAEQVRARDRFIASISHELRTPLTGALGLLEVINDDQTDTAEQADLLQVVLGEVRDLSDIVQDLLVAARADTGTLLVRSQDVDLAELCRSVVDGLEAKILIEGAGESVAVHADPVRVRQIVRNLCTNAIRYGGPERRMVFFDNGVEVRDDGAAIAPEVVATMFEPYGRGPHQRASTDSVGLGLSVARTLAQLMDGEVDYRREGAESVFRLSLPAAR